MPAVQPASLIRRAYPAASAEQTALFERWVEGTADALYRLAARLLGDLDAADDVLQDAYLKAFAALRKGEFKGDSEVKTWLYRIVVNTALNARRSEARRAANLPPAQLEVESRERLEARLRLRELSDWLHELPDDQRAALVLKELEGLTAREVAAVLECTESAVEQKLVRARAALRTRSSE
jgi:RNA polymerase sigma-70 factor (ECF subfamily)